MKYLTSRFSEVRVRTVIDGTGTGIWEHNLATNEVIWNEEMYRIYGCEAIDGPSYGSIWVDSLHLDDRERAIADFERAAVAHVAYASSFRIIRPDGAVRQLLSKAFFQINESGQPCYWGLEWDITGTGSIEAFADAAGEPSGCGLSLETGSPDFDHITGLPNRLPLYEVLRQSTSDSTPVAVVQVDIADFRQINEEFGFEIGDLLLKEIARLLAAAKSNTAQLFRSGSSEFTLVDINPSQSLLQYFATAAIETIHLAAKQIHPGLSGATHVGIAHASAANYGPRLLALSEAALIQAKRRSVPVVFHDDALMSELAMEKLAKQDLRRGIDRCEIEPFYQVQVDSITGEIVGLEALARWRHPDKGILPPSVFLPIANALGVTGMLDELMLRRALKDREDWRAQGLHVPRIAINMSAMRLSHPSLVSSLEATSIQYSGITFELVETVYFDGICDTILERVNALRSLGIEIEIDDFGSGHASLLSLIKMKPERVKIDRLLVNDLIRSKDQRHIILAIIDIARTLSIGVVAEGVETVEQAAMLTEMGCEVLQGYLFGKPEPATETTKRLRKLGS